MPKHILVVDDDDKILLLFERILIKKKYNVTTCLSAYQAIQEINKTSFDLVISDLNLNKEDGLELLNYVKQLTRYIPFIVITGYGTIESAVQAVKSGALEYVIKPFSNQQILKVIDRALKELEYHVSTQKPQQPINNNNAFEHIIGKSTKIKELFNVIERVAPTSATVLIQGESGTGKEVIARAIHRSSLRKDKPFVAINCGVLSENLLENELFGHVKGAFTGAIDYKKGLFEAAHQGTLLLDEIGNMPLTVQTKLLRVLQEKEFKPLGSNSNVSVDVRIIAATNINLKEAVKTATFREDLYYRLAVIPLKTPPLRERTKDIPLLAMHFVKKYSKENNKEIHNISSEAMAKLVKHNWTGNVRELENTIERSVALCTASTITPDLLWQETPDFFVPEMQEESKIDSTKALRITSSIPLKQTIRNATKMAILNALKETKGNRAKAASLLGIARGSLYYKLKEYDILNEL